MRNWRPVSLLCGDYKVLSKAAALRLREVMAEIIHVDQTYCVPGRLISDNITLIWHFLDVSGSLGTVTGLISKDQEKAFDRVEHQYLWKTLAAFVGAVLELTGPDLQDAAGLTAAEPLEELSNGTRAPTAEGIQ